MGNGKATTSQSTGEDGDAMALGNQSDSEGLPLLDDDRRPAILVRRVEAARREGGKMTPERVQERLRQLGLFEFEEVTR